MNGTRPVSIRRIVGAIVSVAFVSVAILHGQASYRLARENSLAETSRPASLQVDLSKPGACEAPFKQVYVGPHSQSVLLKVVTPSTRPLTLLVGLKGSVDIRNSEGRSVLERSVPIPGDLREMEGDIELASFRPFEKGQYVLRLEVTEPAPALAGHTQTLYARYWLCGLETFAAVVNGGIAIACGVVALSVGIPTAIGLKLYGWRRKPSLFY